MAVKGSGELSMLNDIVAEFGGTAPHAMSEYYGGGGLVPAGANPNVPSSGQIRFNNMYNSIAATVLTISSNTNNYNIATAAQQAGGDLNTPVILTINSGVTVGSNSTGSPAMTTGTGWGAGTTINITNQGSIVGRSGSPSSGTAGPGGRGGQGGGANTGASGQAGQAGGRTNGSGANGGQGFVHAQPGSNLSVIFDTTGTRTGGSAGTFTAQGGGGGGGGGGRRWHNMSPVGYYGGGGGGGGARGGGAGAGGPGSIQGEPNYPPYRGFSGNAGGNTTGGNGGPDSYGTGRGGRGGNLQTAGQAGAASYQNEAPGSPGGARANATSNTGSAGQAVGGNTGYIS